MTGRGSSNPVSTDPDLSGPSHEGRLLTRTQHRLTPDASRTICRPFIPGQETLIRGESRAMAVVNRVMALSEQDAEQALARTIARFSDHYRDLTATLDENFELVAHMVGELAVSGQRRMLIGAYFTAEYAVEAAALFNPSIVAHPDQTGCKPGEVRFVMSLRAVGEGHLSSIEFRTGTISGNTEIRFDPAGRFLDTGRIRPVTYDRNLFGQKLTESGHDGRSARILLGVLPPRFTAAELEVALAGLAEQDATGGDSAGLLHVARRMAASSYAVEFDPRGSVSERVLWPAGPAENHGMEDARFVRFCDDGGEPRYYATYTAFDGSQVAPQLLQTSDFRTFTVSQLAGPSAKNKGMALFPRLIGGKYVALSRWDRENIAIGYSADGRRWSGASTVGTPTFAWELVQLGNCGSPIETAAGWLVFTHGVGPMREYAIGAVLLDIDDPEHLIGVLPEPLLLADESERRGYVPNVVYSCGSMLHGQTVVLPYGCSDWSVRIATVDLGLLIDRLTAR
jgi:predicted GH43/DUF377 family glycosyl hydrolase